MTHGYSPKISNLDENDPPSESSVDDDEPHIIFKTEDGNVIEIDGVGITLSSEHSTIEIFPHVIALTDSVIQQYTNPDHTSAFNVLNSGLQVTPFIGLFGGPNPLGFSAGITLIRQHGSDMALRCVGADIEVIHAKILIDGNPVVTWIDDISGVEEIYIKQWVPAE